MGVNSRVVKEYKRKFENRVVVIPSTSSCAFVLHGEGAPEDFIGRVLLSVLEDGTLAVSYYTGENYRESEDSIKDLEDVCAYVWQTYQDVIEMMVSHNSLTQPTTQDVLYQT